jgi:hypothetical protein
MAINAACCKHLKKLIADESSMFVRYVFVNVGAGLVPALNKAITKYIRNIRVITMVVTTIIAWRLVQRAVSI